MNMIIRSVLFAATMAAAFSGISMTGARAQTSGYDGVWSVLVITDKGECDRAYRYPVRIRGGKVGHTDPSSSFNIGGRVGAGGTVKVFVSRADKRADGVGRLTKAGGGGKWKSSRGECSGRWVAERRG
jgi:hypothetical protein